MAEEVSRLVVAQTGRNRAIDGNYVSKLERGVITWPNRAYRQAFRTFFNAMSDAELGFYAKRQAALITEPNGGGTVDLPVSIVHLPVSTAALQ
jgi:hypothetical protein